MEEILKSRIILALIIVILIFFVGMVKSCHDAGQYKGSSNKEIAARLDCEENLANLNREKDALETKLKAAIEELEKIKPDFEATKTTLLQEQLVSKSLQEELDKLIKLKETLEEDLKEALMNTAPDKTKR